MLRGLICRSGLASLQLFMTRDAVDTDLVPARPEGPDPGPTKQTRMKTMKNTLQLSEGIRPVPTHSHAINLQWPLSFKTAPMTSGSL